MPYAAWLREAIGDESAREALGFVATGFMTKPSQSFSLLQAAWLLSSAGEVRNLLDADLVLDARVVGGAQRIALGLAERLGDRVRLGAPVRDVAWTDGGVDVHVPGGEISAARLIVAIPPNLMGTIRFDPPLPAWRMRAEQETSQGSLIKVQAAYDEPFWRADGLSGTGLGPGEPVSEIYDNSPPDGSPGVVVGFLAAGAAEAATRLREPERRRLVLGSLARYLGRGRSSPRTTSSATGTATSGPAARTRRRSASAASRASAPTSAARSARSPSRGATSPASGRCTWTARCAAARPRRTSCSPAARASPARTAAARPRRRSPPPSCARAPAAARSASRG